MDTISHPIIDYLTYILRKTLQFVILIMNPCFSYERVFVAEYQQYKKIKVQKSGKGETGYKSCFLRK